VPSLREQVVFQAVRSAFARASRRAFRLVHYSVQTNQVHVIVEASDTERLSRGVQGLANRLVRRINGALRTARGLRRGKVWKDRYHAR